MSKEMTLKDFTHKLVETTEKIEQAQNDDTPFMVVKDDDIEIHGNPNKTEVKTNDYIIKFRIPKTEMDIVPKEAKAIGDYYVVSYNFKDIGITPRKDLKLVDAILKLKPFILKLGENGDIQERSKEELLSVFVSAGDDVLLGIYNIVATFLGIDDKLGEYMLSFSVIEALNKLIETHPEVFNEADVFFG